MVWLWVTLIIGSLIGAFMWYLRKASKEDNQYYKQVEEQNRQLQESHERVKKLEAKKSETTETHQGELNQARGELSKAKMIQDREEVKHKNQENILRDKINYQNSQIEAKDAVYTRATKTQTESNHLTSQQHTEILGLKSELGTKTAENEKLDELSKKFMETSEKQCLKDREEIRRLNDLVTEHQGAHESITQILRDTQANMEKEVGKWRAECEAKDTKIESLTDQLDKENARFDYIVKHFGKAGEELAEKIKQGALAEEEEKNEMDRAFGVSSQETEKALQHFEH